MEQKLQTLLFLLSNITVSGKTNLNNLLASIQIVEELQKKEVNISEVIGK